jgi:uroporphyrinogen-III decarboxylase
MDGRERYLRALAFSGPDRVPVMHHTLAGARRVHGAGLEQLYRQYPADVLGPFTFADCPRGRWCGGEVSQDDWGCGWLWSTPDHMGQVVSSPLAHWSALEAYRAPDPATGAQALVELRRKVARQGHSLFVFADGGELFQRMFFLRGFEDLLVDLLEERPEVLALRDLVLRHCLERIEILGESGVVDGIILRDDWGAQSALFVSPPLWRRVFKPAYAQLVGAIHAAGARASFHSDGMIAEILPDLLDLGWDELNPQVTVMGVEESARRLGGRVCVRADIDRQHTLPRGSPDDVAALVRRLFEAFGRSGGGFVGWGEVAADVPLANCRAMLETLYSLRY